MSIDAQMEEMQPLVSESKRFDSQEKPKPFALAGLLGP